MMAVLKIHLSEVFFSPEGGEERKTEVAGDIWNILCSVLVSLASFSGLWGLADVVTVLHVKVMYGHILFPLSHCP